MTQAFRYFLAAHKSDLCAVQTARVGVIELGACDAALVLRVVAAVVPMYAFGAVLRTITAPHCFIPAQVVLALKHSYHCAVIATVTAAFLKAGDLSRNAHHSAPLLTLSRELVDWDDGELCSYPLGAFILRDC